MTEVINNKTMDRFDLLTDEAKPIVAALNTLIRVLYSQGLFMSSWYGNLPSGPGLTRDRLKRVIKKALGIEVEDRLQEYLRSAAVRSPARSRGPRRGSRLAGSGGGVVGRSRARSRSEGVSNS